MMYIDIEKSVANGEIKALKKMPKFVINIIKKIIYQDELNRILTECENLRGKDFQNQLLKSLNIKLEIEGLENLPASERCIFFANHPFGLLDGIIISKVIVEKYGDFKAIGNDAFRFVPNLKPHVAVVNAYGPTSKENITALETIFKSNVAVTHFPAGEVSRHYHGKIQDREWRKSIVSRSVSHKRDLVPFYFYGRNSRLFYAINLIRRALFIKLNIELVLLPHEVFNKKNKTFRIRIGKPIPYTTFDKSHTQQEWTSKVREYLYAIGKTKENNLDFTD